MSDNVYTAERILSKRSFNGVTQYYIKWKGYSSKENTWEPVENILDRSLLTAFERKEAKKNKRSSASSSKSRAKDFDERENNIATTSKSATVINPPLSSPRLEQLTANSTPPSVTKSPTVRVRSPVSASTSPVIPKTPPTIQIGVPRKIPTPPQPTITKLETVSTPVVVETKIKEVQVEPFEETIEEIPVQRTNNNNSNNNSPIRMSTTPLPANNIMNASLDNNTPNNSSTKNRRFTSRFAILNTVITDVTVNDQTITISESKTNQGFFKEVSRHSVAVDTTNSGDCIEMVE